jgi:hypothetical protein
VTTQVGGKRYLWNYYNRVSRPMGVIDTTNSWNYTLATWRAADGADGNRVELVIGVAECTATARVMISADSTGAANVSTGVGVDSASVNSAQIHGNGVFGSTEVAVPCFYHGMLSVGYHYLQWIEISQATATTHWYGDAGVIQLQAGMNAECES